MRETNPDEMRREMERFFEHLGRWKRPVIFFEKAWRPRCDVSESDEEVLIVADLAGVDMADLSITLVGRDIVLRGVRNEPSIARTRSYRQMEISYGPFERVIALPCDVDGERAKATYNDGFLEVRLPKTASSNSGEVGVDVTTD